MSPPLISPDDYALIKPYIMLPMILSAFERDKKIIEESGAIKTPAPYVQTIDDAMQRARADLYEIKREFRKRGIKVMDAVLGEHSIEAKYMCRGYNGVFEMQNEYLSAQASVMMRDYLAGTKRPPEGGP